MLTHKLLDHLRSAFLALALVRQAEEGLRGVGSHIRDPLDAVGVAGAGAGRDAALVGARRHDGVDLSLLGDYVGLLGRLEHASHFLIEIKELCNAGF